MDQHVKRVYQSVYFHIWNVNSIRKLLTDETAASIIRALITSRIDNGNSLLTGITDRLFRKLQLAQNAAARFLTKTRKFDHITPIKRPSLATYSWENWLQITHFNLESLEWHCTRVFNKSFSSSLYSKSHASVFWSTITCRSTGFICLWKSSFFRCCTHDLELVAIEYKKLWFFSDF